jgi:hypothetical protein
VDLRALEIGAMADAVVRTRQKSDDSETNAALFCRVDDIKMANLGTSGRRRALTP